MSENGGNDVDKLFSSFYNKLNKIVNKHAPMKVLSQRKAKQLSTPWITRGIKLQKLQLRLKIDYLLPVTINNYWMRFSMISCENRIQ